MDESQAPAFQRLLGDQVIERAARAGEGIVVEPVFVEAGLLHELFRTAAHRVLGSWNGTGPNEVVWTDGANELAVSIADTNVRTADGMFMVQIPVRCDQARDVVDVAFAVGSPDRPAGVYASTFRRPSGIRLIVDVWGDALVAFTWDCLLELVGQIAAIRGKDKRGNLLVPVEIEASQRGLVVTPMTRFRFTGVRR